jgi:DnaJ-class molecular chaperone
MDQDLYRILDVGRTASHDEIRGAYRKLAKESHPDRNPGNNAAEETFKRVSAAFDILGDPEKRKKYDAGQIDGSGRDTPGGFSGDGRYSRYKPADGYSDFGDIFGDVLGRNSGAGSFNMRGMDYRYHLEIDFLEAVNGIKKRVLLPEGETLDINVPSGVIQGQVLRLKGKGGPGVGRGQAGDALIELKIRTHPFFEREGDDIILDLPITIDEAILGGKVEAPTIAGRVSLTIPKGASSGQVLRLRAKGVNNAQSGALGDQLVKLRIVVPQRPDGELCAFLEKWRAAHAYDPRIALKETI